MNYNNIITYKLYSLQKHWWGTRWRGCLRHCVTSRKEAGSITDYITGIFHWHNPSGRTMALWSTQPLREMSTRNISLVGKGDRCVELTTLPPSYTDCVEIYDPQPPRTLRVCPHWTMLIFGHGYFFPLTGECKPTESFYPPCLGVWNLELDISSILSVCS